MNIWQATDKQIEKYKKYLLYCSVATSKSVVTMKGFWDLMSWERDRRLARRLVEAWLKKLTDHMKKRVEYRITMSEDAYYLKRRRKRWIKHRSGRSRCYI